MVAIVCVLAFLATGIVMASEPSDAEYDYCAKIGDTTYTSFDEAIQDANAIIGEVTVEIYKKVNYTDSTQDLNGSYEKINFIGMTDDAEIYIERDGPGGYISGNGNNTPDVSFRDLILSKNQTRGFAGNAAFMNVYFTVYDAGNLNYTNCIFPNGACTQNTTTTYSHCTFTNVSDSNYGLWVYANTRCTVEDCDFTGARGIKMYSESVRTPVSAEERTNDLILIDSRFHETVTKKPAIVLTYGRSIVLENNVYPNTGVFEIDNGDYNNYNGAQIQSDVKDLTCIDASNSMSGVLVTDSDGTTRLYNKASDVVGVTQSGYRVTLLYDTSGETPVTLPDGVTLDVNGHDAGNISADIVIDSADVPEVPTTPSESEDEEYPFFPWGGNNQGVATTPAKDSSDDTTKIIAVTAAVVVIMLAAVALMFNRNN